MKKGMKKICKIVANVTKEIKKKNGAEKYKLQLEKEIHQVEKHCAILRSLLKKLKTTDNLTELDKGKFKIVKI